MSRSKLSTETEETYFIARPPRMSCQKDFSSSAILRMAAIRAAFFIPSYAPSPSISKLATIILSSTAMAVPLALSFIGRCFGPDTG